MQKGQLLDDSYDSTRRTVPSLRFLMNFILMQVNRHMYLKYRYSLLKGHEDDIFLRTLTIMNSNPWGSQFLVDHFYYLTENQYIKTNLSDLSTQELDRFSCGLNGGMTELVCTLH